jgi:hypothetical protein
MLPRYKSTVGTESGRRWDSERLTKQVEAEGIQVQWKGWSLFTYRKMTLLWLCTRASYRVNGVGGHAGHQKGTENERLCREGRRVVAYDGIMLPVLNVANVETAVE